MKDIEINVENLTHAIRIVAYCIQRHNLPQALPTLKRLEAERERLIREGDAMGYARRVLERETKEIEALPQMKLAA